MRASLEAEGCQALSVPKEGGLLDRALASAAGRQRIGEERVRMIVLLRPYPVRVGRLGLEEPVRYEHSRPGRTRVHRLARP